MNIIMIAGLCLTASIICKALEKNSGEIKILLAICTVCIVLFRISGELADVISAIQDLFERSSMDGEYLTVIFKGLGICYITQLGCDCCRECGENVIASQLELAGKIGMVIISLPLFRALIAIIEGLLY